MDEIKHLTDALTEKLRSIESVDDKIDAINYIRGQIHTVSPLRHHPCDNIQWIKSDMIVGNDYNPNSVPPPEMKLLLKSIVEDGYTMPIVTYQAEEVVVVDGFHRHKASLHSPIAKSTYGRVPASTIRPDNTGRGSRIASTIRHNRARGEHDISIMSEIVGELAEAGMSDSWIMKHIGMDADEVLRLKQVSGLASLFKDREFSISMESA